MADEYGGSPWRPARYVNGKLTLGENTADNGGVRVALMALLNTIGSQTAKIDGYHAGAAFLPLVRPGLVRKRARRGVAATGADQPEHAPAEFRVNGVIENMPEFQKAFACNPGQPMAPVHACRVW